MYKGKEIKEITGRLRSAIFSFACIKEQSKLSTVHLQVRMDKSLISKDSTKKGNYSPCILVFPFI
jgi:hypothetical protein